MATTSEILTSILTHQAETRRLLETVMTELRDQQDIGRRVAVLTSRLETLESLQKELLASSRECRDGMSKRIDTAQERHYATAAEIRAECQSELANLRDRIANVDRKAAELGARYGALLGVASALAMEFLHWVTTQLGVR